MGMRKIVKLGAALSRMPAPAHSGVTAARRSQRPDFVTARGLPPKEISRGVCYTGGNSYLGASSGREGQRTNGGQTSY